jgi:hypothetical protein
MLLQKIPLAKKHASGRTISMLSFSHTIGKIICRAKGVSNSGRTGKFGGARGVERPRGAAGHSLARQGRHRTWSSFDISRRGTVN